MLAKVETAIKPVAGFRLTDKQNEVNKVLGGPQTHMLVFGGGRSGKTFLIVRAICIRALRAPGSHHAILRHRFNHVVNSIGGNSGTLPAVLALCFPGLNVSVDRTRWVFTFPNGSEIWLLGLDDKERTEKLLGMEFSTLYYNEASQIKWPAVALSRSRLVEKAKIAGRPGEFLKLRTYTDLNPAGKSHWTYKLWIQGLQPDADGSQKVPNPENYAYAVMNPMDNRENLAPEAIAELEALPEAQRARFLDGRYIDDTEGALFKQAWISGNRVGPNDHTPSLQRIVVAVDPSGSANGDEAGIVAVGRHAGEYYPIEDRSKACDPDVWAKEAVLLYDEVQADALLYEYNFGALMVESTIKSMAREMHRNGERSSDFVNVISVKAFRGKVLRAEPIASLYAQGKVHHVGTFREMEDEMTSFTALWDRNKDGSPGRLDALVMGITDLQESAPATRSMFFGRGARLGA